MDAANEADRRPSGRPLRDTPSTHRAGGQDPDAKSSATSSTVSRRGDRGALSLKLTAAPGPSVPTSPAVSRTCNSATPCLIATRAWPVPCQLGHRAVLREEGRGELGDAAFECPPGQHPDQLGRQPTSRQGVDRDGDFGCALTGSGFGKCRVPGYRNATTCAVARHQSEPVGVVQPGEPVEDGFGERRRPAEEAGVQRLRIRRADRLGQLRRVRRQDRTDADATSVGEPQRGLVAVRIADRPFAGRAPCLGMLANPAACPAASASARPRQVRAPGWSSRRPPSAGGS